MSGSFALDVKAFVNKSRNEQARFFNRLALGLFRNVVKATPVATGRARGNWMIGFAHPLGLEVTADFSPTGSETNARITSFIGSNPTWTLDGKTLYLYNNLPYIQRLEEGYSGQAPAGMVRVNVMALEEAFKDGD